MVKTFKELNKEWNELNMTLEDTSYDDLGENIDILIFNLLDTVQNLEKQLQDKE